MMRPESDGFAFFQGDADIVGVAQSGSCRHHGIQHRLYRVWRLRDDAEHLARRGLVLERFLQLGGPRLDLLEETDVVDRDHRLIGEGGDEVDLLFGERLDLGAGQENDADHLAAAHQRHGELRARLRPPLAPQVGEPRIGERVFEVNDLLFEGGEPRRGAVALGDRVFPQPFEEAGVGVLAGGDVVEPVGAELEQERILGLAKLVRRLDDRVEHRLQVVRRAADDAEHVRGRGLVLERLGQLARARLDLLEQPDVLDCDHGLVRERADEVDLLLGERPDLRAGQDDDPEQGAFAQERKAEDGALPADLLPVRTLELGVGEHVRHMNGPLLERNAAEHRVAVDGHRRPRDELDVGQLDVVGGGEMAGAVDGPRDERVLGGAQLGRRPDDGVEHRLQLGGRPADDVEHVRRRGLILERFGQLGGPRLDLVEQAHVLDRDDGLVGEGGDELDLLVA